MDMGERRGEPHLSMCCWSVKRLCGGFKHYLIQRLVSLCGAGDRRGEG